MSAVCLQSGREDLIVVQYNALNGASVGHLHRQWLYGDAFWGAFFSGRHFNLVALATVITTLVVIDQPLI
jgi:hypothetical protein